MYSRIWVTGFPRSIPCFQARGSQYAPSPALIRPGARFERVAKDIAMRPGPRVQELTIPVPRRMRRVDAAIAPRTENASRARRVSVTQSES